MLHGTCSDSSLCQISSQVACKFWGNETCWFFQYLDHHFRSALMLLRKEGMDARYLYRCFIMIRIALRLIRSKLKYLKSCSRVLKSAFISEEGSCLNLLLKVTKYLKSCSNNKLCSSLRGRQRLPGTFLDAPFCQDQLSGCLEVLR